MKLSMRKLLCYVLCLGALTCLFASSGRTDVGDFNDYDSGSSWSSSSSDSWSSSSSDSWGSGSSSSGSSGRPLTSADLVFWGIIIGIYLIYYCLNNVWKIDRPGLPAKDKWPDLEHASYHPGSLPGSLWPDIPDNTQDITRAIQQTDPGFNSTAFLEWAKEVFFKLQYAWMERDWDKVRPFESEELFALHERQLQEYKRLGRINRLERININRAHFFSYAQDKNFETLSVVMHARMIDYIVDEHTHHVLKGDPNRDCFLSYFYVFKRKAGVKTRSAKQETDTISCPNCGAPTHVVSSGRCEYCNFVITVKDHGWVLADIIGIKPPYNYGPGGVMIKNNPEE